MKVLFLICRSTSDPRDLSPNATYLITDTIYDAAGQALIQTDPRGINTWC